MREVYLAKKGKRALARLIDFFIVLILTVTVYFPAVYPFVFDADQVEINSQLIVKLFEYSGLFFVDDNGNYSAKSTLDTISSVDDLFSKDYTFNGEEYYDVSLTYSLEYYYLNRYKVVSGEGQNLTLNVYLDEVLEVGSENSNIASYNEENHTFTMINDALEATTIEFFLDKYEEACQNYISESAISELQGRNQTLFLGALSYIILVLFVFALISDLIIPLFSPYGQTIGKYIFKIGVVDKDGYHIKKWRLIPRFLAYFFIEVVLGIASFGGVFLISYTMFVFNKRRRSIHDYVAGTTVIDLTRSIIFDSAEQECYFLEKVKEKENEKGSTN